MIVNEYEIFKELNQRLAEERIEMTIICVGGFVLNHYGMRGTQDIDGFFDSSARIDHIIHSVGEKYKINTDNELWLNNSVQNLNVRPTEDICDTLYQFSHLKVMMPPLTYIAGMKLRSARGQDIEDTAEIIKKLAVASPEELLSELEGYGIAGIDESVLLEAFGIAYGMKWLERYFIQNEEIINDRIKSCGFS